MTELEIANFKKSIGQIAAKFFLNEVATLDKMPDPKVSAGVFLLKTLGTIDHREARELLKKTQ